MLSTNVVYIGKSARSKSRGFERSQVITTVVEEQEEQSAGGANGSDAANDTHSEDKLRLLCTAVDEMKARDIVVLDVRGQTIIADFFVICSGTSVTHIQSIVEGVQDRLRERGRLRAKPQGDAHSYWMILDYSDVILHVFDEETREFYDLERLWGDAKVISCPTDAPSASADGNGENTE
jgi:ribosome-associated protein